jgi:hypothetical protein
MGLLKNSFNSFNWEMTEMDSEKTTLKCCLIMFNQHWVEVLKDEKGKKQLDRETNKS